MVELSGGPLFAYLVVRGVVMRLEKLDIDERNFEK
jgi:hypothetical protein